MPCRSCNGLKFSMLVNLYNLLPNILSAILNKDIYEEDQYKMQDDIDTEFNYEYFLENKTYIYHYNYNVAHPIEMTGIAAAFYETLANKLYILDKDDYMYFIGYFNLDDERMIQQLIPNVEVFQKVFENLDVSQFETEEFQVW